MTLIITLVMIFTVILTMRLEMVRTGEGWRSIAGMAEQGLVYLVVLEISLRWLRLSGEAEPKLWAPDTDEVDGRSQVPGTSICGAICAISLSLLGGSCSAPGPFSSCSLTLLTLWSRLSSLMAFQSREDVERSTISSAKGRRAAAKRRSTKERFSAALR